jgi:hypothetical protein
MTQAQYFFNKVDRRKQLYGDLGTWSTFTEEKRPAIKKPEPPKEPVKFVEPPAKKKPGPPKKSKPRRPILMIHKPTDTKLYSMDEVAKLLDCPMSKAMINVLKYRHEFRMVRFPKFVRTEPVEHVATGIVYDSIYRAAWELKLCYDGICAHIKRNSGRFRRVKC